MNLSRPVLKKVSFVLIFSALCTFSFAQDAPPKSEFWKNVRFGGGIGLGFTNGGFNGTLAPSAIYQFNDQFASGVSLSLNYAKFDDNKFLAYGGSILSLYNPIPFLQLSGEFEQLRVSRDVSAFTGTVESNYWAPALFLGVGYTSQFATIGIRYDVLYDDSKSIYANAWMPFVRVYF